jgi:hypothetical protein
VAIVPRGTAPPFTLKLPVILTEPVNSWVLVDSEPNLVEPVIKLTLDVIVCTTSVCAVIGPVTVKLPVIVASPDSLVDPETSSLVVGLVIPIPTLPDEETDKYVLEPLTSVNMFGPISTLAVTEPDVI